MKTLPIAVLAHEGPILRAYLERLRISGRRVARIIHLVYEKHVATRKELGLWLPPPLRVRYNGWVNSLSLNHWPRYIRLRHGALFTKISDQLSYLLPSTSQVVEQIIKSLRLSDYADHVQSILIEDFRDPALLDTLGKIPEPYILFTGGGILPNDLLNLSDKKFLHVHPGFLPDIRGADGFLWSILTSARAGASCFVMNSGIDTGRLLMARHFEPFEIDLSGIPRPNDVTLYRATCCFIDPILRAETLINCLEGCLDDLALVTSVIQRDEDGVTFHFMHPKMLRRALECVYKPSSVENKYQALYSHQEIKSLLIELMGHCGLLPPVCSGIDSVAMIGKLARHWPEPLDATSLNHLHRICRKIDVSRDFLDTYSPTWDRVRRQVSIPASAWELLIATLCAYSGEEYSNRSLGLKLLNSALKSLDILSERSQGGYTERLIGWADGLLEKLSKADSASYGAVGKMQYNKTSFAIQL